MAAVRAADASEAVGKVATLENGGWFWDSNKINTGLRKGVAGR